VKAGSGRFRVFEDFLTSVAPTGLLPWDDGSVSLAVVFETPGAHAVQTVFRWCSGDLVPLPPLPPLQVNLTLYILLSISPEDKGSMVGAFEAVAAKLVSAHSKRRWSGESEGC